MKPNAKGLKLFNFRLVTSKRMNVLETSLCTSKKTPAKHLFFLTKAVSKIHAFEMNCT